MFGFTKKHNYNTEECYKHISNSLISISKNETIKVFGFVSSNKKTAFLDDIVKNIAKRTSEKDIRTLVINVVFDNESSFHFKEKFKLGDVCCIECKNIFADKFTEELSKQIDKYNLILVSINSITSKAEALEYTKSCENIIIVEKCTDCYYSDYENMLVNFKSAGIKPLGVITVD